MLLLAEWCMGIGTKDPEVRVVGEKRQGILDQRGATVGTSACPALWLQPSRALLFLHKLSKAGIWTVSGMEWVEH